MPRIDISSTLLRARAARGEGLRTSCRRRSRARSRRAGCTRGAEEARHERARAADPEQLADVIAGYALDKKAHDVVTLDLRGLSGFTDAFVVCSGTSDRQAKAIHDAIHLGLKKSTGCCRAASKASRSRAGS